MKKIPLTQICIGCGKRKNLEKFYRWARGKYGRQAQCIECRKIYKRVHPRSEAQRKRDRIYNRKYRANNKDKINARMAKYRATHRKEFRARYKIEKRKRRGYITEEPCQVCRTTKNLHGHHPDYDKPLEIIWLCPLHHSKVHQKPLKLKEES